MMTLFNYWHFIVLIFVLLIGAGGVYMSLQQPKAKVRIAMLISSVVVTLMFATFTMLAVDKYTKVVKLYKLDNKRILSTEKIVYTGIVKNEGNHEIGEVTFQIKLVNKGHATGNLKSASFFSPSGFMDFFSGGANILYKPPTVVKKFVVAKNLKPGEAKRFRVYFRFPSYFRSVSQFPKVYGH